MQFSDANLSYLDKIHDVVGPLIPTNAPVALFDFPSHPNVGDSAIWLGEIRYLDSNTMSPIVAVDDLSIMNSIFPKLSKQTVILIHGGGNLGDLWPMHQLFRERLIQHYQNNRIIQLPQSIHFQSDVNREKCRKIFNSHNDFP